MKKISRNNAIIICLGVGLVATLLMVKSVNAIGGPRVQMVMVNSNVKAGTPILSDNIRTETMPAKYAVDAVTNEDEAIGQLAAIDLSPGHPLLKADISDKPMKNGLYQGEVAVRVAVNAVTSGGSMPGDYVDILVATGKNSNGQPTSMQTMFRHKRVIALYNASGQKIVNAPNASSAAGITMTPAAVYVPTVAELALSSIQERDILMSSGTVALSLAPWDSSAIDSYNQQPNQNHDSGSNLSPGQNTIDPANNLPDSE